MKIMFVSDMYGQWKGFRRILGKEKPNVLLIGGRALPEVYYHEDEKSVTIRKRGTEGGKWSCNTVGVKDFAKDEMYRRSVSEFYSALRYAARRCRVFTVRERSWIQDIDDKNIFKVLSRAYDTNRIDAIDNCKEVTGKTADVEDLRLLGLGGFEFGFLRKLRPIISDAQKNPPDIILAAIQLEAGKRNPRIEWICKQLHPRIKLFAYGHYGPFQPMLVNKTWIAVSGAFPSDYAVVTMDQHSVKDIVSKKFCQDRDRFVDVSEFCCLFRSCGECIFKSRYKEIKDKTLLDLAYRLTWVFPRMVEICSNKETFILIADMVKITKKGVIRGYGPLAERAQEVYESFVREKKSRVAEKLGSP